MILNGVLMTDIITNSSMVNIILINPDFVTDIITNSSSELFVCDTDNPIEVVKEILQELINIEKKTGNSRHYNFSDVFGEIGYAKHCPSLVDEYVSYKKSWRNPFDWRTENDKYREWDQNERQKAIDSLPDGFDDMILVRSASDNSIPWWTVTAIEDLFNAERTHLG